MRLGKKKEKEKENEPKSQSVDGVTRLICSAKTHNIPLKGKFAYYSIFYLFIILCKHLSIEILSFWWCSKHWRNRLVRRQVLPTVGAMADTYQELSSGTFSLQSSTVGSKSHLNFFESRSIYSNSCSTIHAHIMYHVLAVDWFLRHAKEQSSRITQKQLNRKASNSSILTAWLLNVVTKEIQKLCQLLFVMLYSILILIF